MKNKTLNQKYTDKEMADSFVFRTCLSSDEKIQSDADLKEFRAKLQGKTSSTQILLSRLFQLKYQIEDYLKKPTYDTERSFAYFLKIYLETLGKKHKEFANDISIKETELSQILNKHRNPSEKIFIRLEIHSNKIIPAITWFKLVEKQKEFEIMTDNGMRVRERSHVNNILTITT